MTTVAEQITRIQQLLQDETFGAFSRPVILEQQQNEMSQLSRRNLWGEVLWLQAIRNQEQYTLPVKTSAVKCVLYDEMRLEYATEEMLDRRRSTWESRPGKPRYWTMDGQEPNVLRIVPAPLLDGSAVPVFPPLPFIQDPVDNLVVFLYEDWRDRMNDEQDTVPCSAMFRDVLWLRTAMELAAREGEYQNLPVAAATRELADVWLQASGVTP